MDLMARVNALESTTFCGRRFSRLQILQIAETVTAFPKLSRSELARTLCEHFDWGTATHALKINSALELLGKLETLGICDAPPAKVCKRGSDKIHLLQPNISLTLTADLAEIVPISLKVVDQTIDRHRFNSLMAKHHYLGYKRPFGAHLRYFILDKEGRELGLILFAASAWALKDRDGWLGWERKHRIKRLHLIVSNSRFLIFPSVKVANLASKALALVTTQLALDWHKRYGYKPVLIESFVDQEKFLGTTYQAANWTKLGETAGRGRFDIGHAAGETVKDIYVQPLCSNFRDVLVRGEAAIQAEKELPDIKDRLCQVHDNVLSFWDLVAPLIRTIAEEFDGTWRLKCRVIDSMLLVLLIFRLVVTRAKHGYGTTIDELWDNCRRQGLPLPQKEPIAVSSFGVARLKLDEQIFKTINNRVIKEYEKVFDRDEYRFFGHRLYAVDGSKINLPRALINNGFLTPSATSHYPQGLLSSLYRLKAQIPADFILTDDCNERRAALAHLSTLAADDIVVYDRGYFSYGMLHKHLATGIHAVFRLSTMTYDSIKEFMQSDDLDRLVIIEPKDKKRRAKIKKAYPGIVLMPLQMRLIKYQISGKDYYLGTTLIGEQYAQENFKDLYHGRWGIEELYKISKQFISIEEFHAKSERGVKQELYAHLTLITLNRIFSNHTDDRHRVDASPKSQSTSDKVLTNFKSCMAAVARNLESLFLNTAESLKKTIHNVINSVARRHQKVRPNRSYPRRSLKPKPRWQSTDAKVAKEAA